jgi:hypothetical protein
MNNRFKSLSNAQLLDGGRAVAFTIERHDGASLDISCETIELADIISYLAGIGMLASTERTPKQGAFTAVRIPSQGIGFGAPTPEESMLAVNLRSFQLMFPISNSDLTRLADDVSRIAKTLAADASKKN